MSRPFFARRRRWPLYVLLLGAGIVLAAAAGLVAEAALSSPPRENFRLPHVGPLPGASPVSHARDRARAAGSALRVIRGRRAAGGIRTGFPDTLAGAVSAAVADWTWVACELDPAAMSVIGRAITAPSWRHGPAELAAGVRGTRIKLGLTAAGPVPAGTRLTFTAVEYQVRGASRRQVTVLLLAYYAVTVPGHQSRLRTGVYPATMRWFGDWKLAAPHDPGYSWLLARPGSAQAAAYGWRLLFLLTKETVDVVRHY
jgi:hypothetical protein